MLDAHGLDALQKRIFYPVGGFNGFSADLLIGGGAADAATRHLFLPAASTVISKNEAADANAVGATAAADRNIRLRSIGNGNPRIVPVSTLNVSGLLVAVANDGAQLTRMVPHDLDRHQPIGIRAVWTSEAAAVGARTITFQVLYGLQAVNAALAAPATALNTLITAQAPAGTALALQRGNRGVINARTLAAGTYWWTFQVLMTAFDAAFTEAKYLLGLELDYTPRTLGRRALRQPSTTEIMGS